MANKILKWVRVGLALVFLLGLTALFCDPYGVLRPLHVLAHAQFVPSVLCGMAIWVIILLLTLLFGRIYCSVICPLGIFQDVVAWIGKLGKKRRKFKYSHSKEKTIPRFLIFILFMVAFCACSYPIVRLLEPYSIFGRFATSVLAPISRSLFSWLAVGSAEAGNFDYAMPPSLAFSPFMLGLSIGFIIIISVLAFRNGRTYCNVVCPVGTFLSLFAERSVFRMLIKSEKCKHCGLCARACKAACIDPKTMTVDASRCVMCMDCTLVCSGNAIEIGGIGARKAEIEKRGEVNEPNAIIRLKDLCKKEKSGDSKGEGKIDESRRTFLTVSAMLGTAMIAEETKAKKHGDGGLAKIIEKEVIEREDYITPPGSVSHKRLHDVCTACGLCITACPNNVLRPSASLDNLLTPVMSFENGYCRPECKRCSDVCPTGAIKLKDLAEKSATHIGHAVLRTDRCLPLNNGVSCGNCARHCPAGAITMVPSVADDPMSPKMPNIDSQRCIGCGACEYLCPSRPLSAIYVEGHRVHRVDE